MKLAVRKDEGSVPGGGFHYFLHPIEMQSNVEAQLFGVMGYVLIEVEEERGKALLTEAREALRHQVDVAYLVDGPNNKRVIESSPPGWPTRH